MKKRNKSHMYNYSFESKMPSSGKFVKICRDMMESMAWKELSMRTRGLYLHLKSIFSKKPNGDTNQDDISIIYSDYKREYGSKQTLMDDVDELIEHGFIKVVRHGKYARLPNIYGFTDMWQKYNTKDFFIHPNDRRLTNDNKYK